MRIRPKQTVSSIKRHRPNVEKNSGFVSNLRTDVQMIEMGRIMRNKRKHETGYVQSGFTLIELIIVVVILGIAAMMAIPMVSSAADVQVRAAANHIAADLDYAKSLAITNQRNYAVVFDPSGESYEIHVDPAGANTVIEHPVNPGDFVVDFSSDGNLDQVNLVSADFDSDTSNAVTFNYMGSPYSGMGTTTPLNNGQITLQADNFTLTIDIEPVTGYATISGF